jgi:MFS family permease
MRRLVPREAVDAHDGVGEGLRGFLRDVVTDRQRLVFVGAGELCAVGGTVTGRGILALRHRALATTSIVGLLYNWGFFTLLGCSPFLMHLSPLRLGAVFCGWGVLVALFAVFGAPRLKARFGTPGTLYVNFALLAADLAIIGIWPDNVPMVITAVIVAGAFLGVNNTLVTTAVMSIAPVERSVASATYGFVRFIGGGLAPFAAAKLVEHSNTHVPFLVGTATVLAAALVLSTVHRALDAAGRGEITQPELNDLDRFEHEEELQVGAGLGNVDQTREPFPARARPQARQPSDRLARTAAESVRLRSSRRVLAAVWH